MKVFNKSKEWRTKVNFVDDNNVFVGYDIDQQCCENADWFITNHIITEKPTLQPQPEELEEYNFDISFIEKTNHDWLDVGGMVIFKLIHPKKEPLYLHLYNCHNGYYSHGFSFKIGENLITEGSL